MEQVHTSETLGRPELLERLKESKLLADEDLDRTLTAHPGADGETLAAGYNNHKVRVWDMRGPKPKERMN